MQHPNIIRLLDVFENHDQIFIVMECLKGGDLFSYLERRNFKISEDRARSIVHQLTLAVFYLHSYGVAHRDIKPENILLEDNGEQSEVRLTDFGLSRIIGPNETSTEPFGTLVRPPRSLTAPLVLRRARGSSAARLRQARRHILARRHSIPAAEWHAAL